MANILNLNRSGAVGFIDWLDVGPAIMAAVKLWTDEQHNEDTQAHSTSREVHAMNKPKFGWREMRVVICFVQREVETEQGPSQN